MQNALGRAARYLYFFYFYFLFLFFWSTTGKELKCRTYSEELRDICIFFYFYFYFYFFGLQQVRSSNAGRTRKSCAIFGSALLMPLFEDAVHPHTHTHIHTQTHAHTHKHTHNTCLYVCVCVCEVCVCVRCVCVCASCGGCVYAVVCVCIYACIYTFKSSASRYSRCSPYIHVYTHKASQGNNTCSS
jgi:hypothetical protein